MAGFGKAGEGYVRFALVYEPEILENAVQKIAEFLSENQNKQWESQTDLSSKSYKIIR